MNKVAVFIKPSQDDRVIKTIEQLFKLIEGKDLKLVLEEERRELLAPFSKLANCIFKPAKIILKDVDGIITLGGDGTLLGAIRSAAQQASTVPILSFNLGKLGFNTEFPLEELEKVFPLFIENQIPLTKKQLFKVEITNKQKISTYTFFNDVVVSRNDISRMFSLEILCSNDLLYQLSGDGVIISSPIGSTAYSLAAGGPIVHPEVESLIVTPICPHSLNQRSVVVPGVSPISIRFPHASSVIMTLDGQEIIELDNEMQLTINRSEEHYVYLAQNPNGSYFKKLADKFINGL